MASASFLVLAASIGGASAQERAAAGAPQQTQTAVPSALDEITVSAERTPSTVYNAPGTVTIITDRQIDDQQVHGPREAVRYEPGISVQNTPTRAGAGGFTIRGVGDNRVRMEVDGIRVPDYPQTNAGAGLYNRDQIDYDTLKRIEIIRGPASALYGSDAIGGVVTFLTKDPTDYLREVGKDWYAGTKLSYDGVNQSFNQTYTGAARKGPFEFMFQYTRRDGYQINVNSNVLRANPQAFQSNNILTKLIYETPDSGRWRLTGEAFWLGVRTDILTERSSTVADSIAHDTNKRFRISLDWTQQLSWAIADQVKFLVYGTDFDRQEHQDQWRKSVSTVPAANRLRVSDFDFRQQIFGADLQFTALRQWGAVEHQFVYGATIDYTLTSRPRDRYELNLQTGTSTNVISGETFPNKNFPDTRTTLAAVYIQDIMQYGALRLIPAIRLDYYNLQPRPDAAFLNSATFTVEPQSRVAVSPKLGATYDLSENYRLFAQYAHGFRAPPYDNANFAYSNPVFGYQILPNGNLRPETSDGFEAGLRGRFNDGSSFQVSAFYNFYHDFIDTKILGTQNGLLTYQYQNLSSVRIWGIEARGEWRMTPEWSLTGAVAYANGRDQTTGQPIDTVDPLTGTAGLRYTSPTNWQVEARLRAAAAKNDVSSVTVFKPAAWATFDLLGRYDINPNLTVSAGIFNIANARYFNARDVAGIAANTATLELYRAPGRSASVTVQAKF